MTDLGLIIGGVGQNCQERMIPGCVNNQSEINRNPYLSGLTPELTEEGITDISHLSGNNQECSGP